MSVLIRQAKVIDPESEFHNKVVDLSVPESASETIKIQSPENGGYPAVIRNNEVVWEARTGKEQLCIAPGFVDVFADYCEPGYEHKETIASGLRAAAAGGFTDVLLAPNTLPSVSTKSTVQFIVQKGQGNIVTLHPLGSITQDIEGKSLAEMLDMYANGAVAFTDGWKPVQNAGLMLKSLEYARSFGGVLIQIPMDASISAGGLMHEGVTSTYLGMAGIPVITETIFLNRDIELLRYTGSRLHVTGISTEKGISMIREAKKEGLDITCSVTPYHLVLTDEALLTYDSLYKVKPVLRSETDRQALIEGLTDGTVDCIASHHRPQEWDSKAREFEYAGDGMNTQEIAVALVLDALQKKIPLERVIQILSIRPRQIFGLPSHIFSAGLSGGWTLFTTDDSTELTKERVQSASANNPFIGKKLKGRVIGIMNNHMLHLNH